MSSESINSIRQLKAMATDYEMSKMLIKDPVCIGSLVMILSNKDPSVVLLALETIESLAKWSDLRNFLGEFLGMEDQLISLMMFACPSIKRIAQNLHDVLYCNSSPMEYSGNEGFGQPRTCGKVKRTDTRVQRGNFFVNTVIKSRTAVFQVHDLLNKEDVDTCRNILLQVKGIISITFDMKKSRAILRTRPELPPEVIARTIANNSYLSAEQVIKDKNGKESFVSFECNSNSDSSIMPNYPRMEDSVVVGDQNLVPCSRQSRDGSSWSFIQTVGTFLTKSFYW